MSGRVGPIVGSVVFFALAPGVVAGWIPYALSGWELRPPFFGLAVIRGAGVILLVGSVGVLVDSFARFALEGRGTPAPVAPTNTLVVSGLYRHVRNPMYVAVVGAILGQALLLGSRVLLAYAAGIWTLFHLFVLTYEEPTLRQQFGASYEAYRREVGRWWPRLRPWNAAR